MVFKTNAVLRTANATRYKIDIFHGRWQGILAYHRRYTPQIDILMLRCTRPVHVGGLMGVWKEEMKLTYPSDFMDVVGLL
jgi:hypothetical protein